MVGANPGGAGGGTRAGSQPPHRRHEARRGKVVEPQHRMATASVGNASGVEHLPKRPSKRYESMEAKTLVGKEVICIAAGEGGTLSTVLSSVWTRNADARKRHAYYTTGPIVSLFRFFKYQ